MYALIIIVFVLGYAAIAFEHSIKINKAATALLTGVLCWAIYIMTASGEMETEHILGELMHHFGGISGILFFLLGAMTIVELIDAHDGFNAVTDLIRTTDKRKLLWIISFIAFFLSSVLDNLTTTIVMVSLIRKLISAKNDRLLFVGMIIIAANAGGAWSPIGDVTTTMLWIGGQITTAHIIPSLILPCLVCLTVPLIVLSFSMKGKIEQINIKSEPKSASKFDRNLILFTGIGALVFVPVFKVITHLPPFMGVLFGLGILWIVSEIIHKDKDDADKDSYSIVHALRKIDASSILFFLGILIAISALESTKQLSELAAYMDNKIGNESIIVLSIGLFSAVIDNVPLVAASMGMYDLSVYPTDHFFWEFLAYCAGTGGSILIIGSAAGVAAMGMEKIEFFWYLKKIGWLALLGYVGGSLVYILQSHLV
ncbi:MAG: sodium:proton antiporter NhaD [Bacteroidota bacterium]